jgi:chromosome partitioning protein
MHVLVVASQKGGSGKTTLSGHLAVEAGKCGYGPVALIDTDPQGSLSQWWDARNDPDPFFVTAGLLNLAEAVERLRAEGFRLVVIDTPPAITVSISQAIAHADLVVLPARPSPHDLRALRETLNLTERYHKPLLFVLNGATPRARINGESEIALAQYGPVAPVTIHHRVDFAASMVDGRTVGEVAPHSPSAKEIHTLWNCVQERLAIVGERANVLPDLPGREVSLDMPNVAIEMPLSVISDDHPHIAAGLDVAAQSQTREVSVAAAEPTYGARLIEPRNGFGGIGEPRAAPGFFCPKDHSVESFGKRNLNRQL